MMGEREVNSQSSRWPETADRNHVTHGLRWHRIGPVLYQRSKESGELDRQPLWFSTFLKQSFIHTTAQNLAIESEMTAVVQALHEAGVPVVLLKGAALMRTAYEQIGLRPMVDVDLLVRAEDLYKASVAISRVGYRSLPVRRHLQNEHHLKFVGVRRAGTRLFIELHWRLSDQPTLADRLPPAELWDRSEVGSAPWGTARVFELCDQVLHAALHLAEHFGVPQLRWLCDLHQLALRVSRTHAWQTLARRAVQYDLQLILAAGLQEAAHWFDTRIPLDFWHELGKGLPGSETAESVFHRCGAPELVEFQIQELRAIRTMHGRIEHVLNLLFPDARFIRLRHRVPRESAVWPYYLLRLGNGIRTGLRSLLNSTIK
jgi:hypothetical protein